MNLDTDLTPATKNSKWIIFSNVKYQTIKLLDYNMGEYLDNLVYGNDFLSTTPKTWPMRGKKKIGKLNFIVIKDFYSMKDTFNRMRRQAMGLEKILAKNKPLKEL